MLQRLLVGLRSSQHPVLPVVRVVPATFLVLQLVLQLVAPVLGQLVASSVHPPEASLEPPVAAQLVGLLAASASQHYVRPKKHRKPWEVPRF